LPKIALRRKDAVELSTDALLAFRLLRGALADPLFQFQVELADLLLIPLHVVDIGAGTEPLNDFSLWIAQRYAPHEKPAVAAIGSSQTTLDAIGIAGGHGMIPGIPRRLLIVGVEWSVPAPAVTRL
jgi:hypothetical protein